MADVDSTVSGFLAKFPVGFARPNRYLIEFMLPPGVPSGGGFMNSESQVGSITGLGMTLNQQGAVNISCHTCSMPSRTLMTYDHVQHSAPFKIPYSQQYDLVTFSFYAHTHLRARHFFDVWQTAVVNINDNSMNFLAEYASNIQIHQLDLTGSKTYGVTLYAAYPISIGDVEYSYGNMNQVQNISVSMAFKLWKSDNDRTDIVLW